MEDIKPHYRRKPRKDGTARKARVFGRPWWYEKAGWTEERWNERRSAILEKLREKWPDWTSFEQDAPTEDGIKQWISPVVATFDDSSWCSPEANDGLQRLEAQLTIYSAGAKVIIREASRFQMARNVPDQDTTSPGLQIANRLVTRPERKISRRSTDAANVVGVGARGTHGTISHQWRQTRPSRSRASQNLSMLEQRSRTNSFDTKRKASNNDGSTKETVRTPSRRPIDVADHRSLDVSPKPQRLKVFTASDEEEEMTEVSDSEPLRHAELSIETSADRNIHRDNESRSFQKWRDDFWDDVVVTIDATSLNGEYFPIPMTMLKPGSSRAACRWDDFELDDLYARFKVEAGFEIDRSKYVIVWSVDETTTMTINIPGKYKLMLKEFAEKTRRSSAMVLYLRIIERTSLVQTPIRDVRQQNLVHDWKRAGEKRSQFTGAASDFSSDSDSELARPPPKRQKPASEREPTPSEWGPTAEEQKSSPDAWSVDRAPKISAPQVMSDLLKVRDSPEEFTQDSS